MYRGVYLLWLTGRDGQSWRSVAGVMEDDIGEAWKGPSVTWNRAMKLQGGSRFAQGSSGVEFRSKVHVECVSRGFKQSTGNGFCWMSGSLREEGGALRVA